MYEANRTAILSLEQHLEQYGYCRPPGAVLEPESLQDARGLQDDGGERPSKLTATPCCAVSVACVCILMPTPTLCAAAALCTDGDYSLDAEGLSAGRASWALPSSSVSAGVWGVLELS